MMELSTRLTFDEQIISCHNTKRMYLSIEMSSSSSNNTRLLQVDVQESRDQPGGGSDPVSGRVSTPGYKTPWLNILQS